MVWDILHLLYELLETTKCVCADSMVNKTTVWLCSVSLLKVNFLSWEGAIFIISNHYVMRKTKNIFTSSSL